MATSIINSPFTETPSVSRPIAVTKRRAVRRHVSRLPRIGLGGVEGILVLFIAALGLVYAGTQIGESIVTPKSAPVIKMTVKSGDTLWSLAARYGNPEDYILKRVDHLAAVNNMTAGTALHPGDVILVPVENPSQRYYAAR